MDNTKEMKRMKHNNNYEQNTSNNYRGTTILFQPEMASEDMFEERFEDEVASIAMEQGRFDYEGTVILPNVVSNGEKTVLLDTMNSPAATLGDRIQKVTPVKRGGVIYHSGDEQLSKKSTQHQNVQSSVHMGQQPVASCAQNMGQQVMSYAQPTGQMVASPEREVQAYGEGQSVKAKTPKGNVLIWACGVFAMVLLIVMVFWIEQTSSKQSDQNYPDYRSGYESAAGNM